MSSKSTYIVAIVCFLTVGCHSLKFEVSDKPVGRVVTDSKAFFLYGVVPTQNVDLKTICPEGTVSVAESTSFLEGFLGAITIGIYTPRSSTYSCAAGV